MLFPIRKGGIFRSGQEIKGLHGGVHGYAAQVSPKIDTASAEKNPFRTEADKKNKDPEPREQLGAIPLGHFDYVAGLQTGKQFLRRPCIPNGTNFDENPGNGQLGAITNLIWRYGVCGPAPIEKSMFSEPSRNGLKPHKTTHYSAMADQFSGNSTEVQDLH
ncbi:MAG: hypothetical protein WB930_19360 [Syntrophobacteraceae bacterium]